MSLRNPRLQLLDYKSDIFFETGTYQGYMARIASEIGFNRVITVELQRYLYDQARSLSSDYHNIEFFLGDSPTIIKEVLTGIDETKTITFWLDAHIDPGNFVAGQTPDIRKCPLYDEINAIKMLKRNDYTILIDDLRIFTNDNSWGVNLQELIDSIKQINSQYKITFIDGEVENDVLVAKV